MHAAQPLVSERSTSEVEIAVAKLKKYKMPSIGQVLAYLIQTGGENYTLRTINLLILF
jgi:hypothetical protein